MSELLTGAQIMCRTLVDAGVDVLFGYPGGAIMPFRDAFQETDVVGVTQPVTKHNVLVRDVEELADDVREAMAIAVEGRPGPVLVDVPKDVQNQKAEYRSRP